MDNGKIFGELIKICRVKGMRILLAPLEGYNGRLYKERIGISYDMDLEAINKTLAHELTHAYLHYDKGNIVDNKDSSYEEQADRAAVMLLNAIQIVGGAQG